MGRLIIFFGASKSGKTTLLDQLLKKELIQSVSKYSTREKRACDDTIFVDKKELEKKCDIIYELNNNYYGFNTEEIEAKLSTGNDVGIILSDINSIKILVSKFETEVYLVYRDTEFYEMINIEINRFDNYIEQHFQNLTKLPFFEKFEKELILSFLNNKDTPYITKLKKTYDNENFLEIKQILDKHQELRESFKKRMDEEINLLKEYKNNKDIFSGVIRNEGDIEQLFKTAISMIFDKNKNYKC